MAIIFCIATFYNDRCKHRATIESTISNTRYTIGDSDRGKTRATLESITSNARYAIWNSDRGKTRATRESRNSNTRYAIGDNGILTACNQRVSGSFYNRITFIMAIIFCIATFYNDRCKHRATIESKISNTRYTVWNSDRGKTGATIESTISNTRYTVWNSDRGKTRATSESTISNTRYAIGDGDRGKAGATLESITSNARYAINSVVVSFSGRDNYIATIVPVSKTTNGGCASGGV